MCLSAYICMRSRGCVCVCVPCETVLSVDRVFRVELICPRDVEVEPLGSRCRAPGLLLGVPIPLLSAFVFNTVGP